MKITKKQLKNTETFLYSLLDIDMSKQLDPIVESFELWLYKQSSNLKKAI